MLKFYKEMIANTTLGANLQTMSLVIFMLFFLGVVALVLLRSKNYYKEASELPLED